MARKVIKNKKKIQPKLKTRMVRPKPQPKVQPKQKTPELRQKQKQIVNIHIDQSKKESDVRKSSNIPQNIINSYPLIQDHPPVPPIIRNYHQSHHNQTNHFQSAEEGVRNGFNNPTYQRGNVRVDEPPENNIIIEELPQPHQRQHDFQTPDEVVRNGFNQQQENTIIPATHQRHQNTLRAGGGGSGGRIYHEPNEDDSRINLDVPFGKGYKMNQGIISPLADNESFTFIGDNPMNRDRRIPQLTSPELNFIENQLTLLDTRRGRGRPRNNVETLAHELDMAELINRLNLNTREELDANGVPQIYIENPYRTGRQHDYVLVRGNAGKDIIRRRYNELNSKAKSKK
jgi:hypothetical protein